MSWQQYVDDGLVGTGKVAAAAIYGQDTSVWAHSAMFPSMGPEQVRALLTGFADPSGLRASGIRVGEDKYITLRCDDRSIYGKKGGDGIICVKTKQGLIVAIYGQNMVAGEAAKSVEGLADYLISVGY